MKRIWPVCVVALLATLFGCSPPPISDIASGPPLRDTLLLGYNFVRKIVYKSDSSTTDYWQTPRETMEKGTGDCEDIAFLLEDIWNREGWKDHRVVFGLFSADDPDTGHAWNEVYLGGEVYVFDATIGVIERKTSLGHHYRELISTGLGDRLIAFRLKEGKGQ